MTAADEAVPPDRLLERWRGWTALGRRTRRLGALAVVTGTATGLGVAAFDRVVALGLFERLLEAPLWLQATAPAAGLVAAAVILATVGRGASPSTADEYIKAFHDHDHELDTRPVPARLLASAATLGTGAAMGFEGPSMYLGAAVGNRLQRRFGRSFGRADAKVLLVCGAAAGVSAIFKAPVTGLVFALEVPYREDLARRMLLPAMFASAASYVAYVLVNGVDPLFPVAGAPPFDLRDLGGAALLGLAAGIGARGVSVVLRRAKDLAATRSARVRLPAVGVALVATFVATRGLTGESLSLGSGYATIDWALRPGHALAAVLALFALRLLATALAVAGGGVGGLFVPLVVQGALVGAALESLVHAPDPSFFPLLGVAAFLGAGYRVPLAAVVFVAETTGRPGFVVPGLLAAAASQLLMGSSSVTPYQEGERTSSLDRRLRLPVTAALRTDASTVPPDATVTELLDHHVRQLRMRVVPVVDGSRYLGMAYLIDVAGLGLEERSRTEVGDVCRRDAPTGQLTWTLGRAVEAMEAGGVERLAILDGDAFVGVLTWGEVLKLGSILDDTGEPG